MSVDQTPAEGREEVLERSLHRRVWLLLALLGAVVASLAVAIFAGHLCVGAISALLAPLFAVTMLFVRLMPSGSEIFDARFTRLARRANVFIRCIALLGLLAGCAVLLHHVAIARAISLSAVSRSNIRGVLQAIEGYHRDHGDYPTGLADLLDEDWVTAKQLLCPWDWPADERMVAGQGYSSYVYNPGHGPYVKERAVILIYERLPWSYGRATWCCPAGYGVGFADMSVRWLSVDQMSEALSRDSARRTELGWPIVPAMGRIPAQASRRATSTTDR